MNDLETMREIVEKTIKATVNGKIDKLAQTIHEHNCRHEEDMAEMREKWNKVIPIVENYDAAQKTIKSLKGFGTSVTGLGIFVSTLIGTYLLVKQFFTK